MAGYIGVNGKAKGISDIYVGVDGKAKKVIAGFVGDENGKAKQFYSENTNEAWKFTVKDYISLDLAGEDLVIRFGDGAKRNINSDSTVLVEHQYDDENEHQIVITGIIKGFNIYRGEENLLSIDTPVPANNITSFYGAFGGCTSLTSIPSGLFDNCTEVTSFAGCFGGCTSLTSIPSGLFDNCTAVTDFSQCFDGCTSLTSIPSGLFDNCTAVTDFASCFHGCESLTSIPSGLFDNCTEVTNFFSCFHSCTLLTGPAPELWDKTKWPDVTQNAECFYNCTGLSNYADIPSDWK